MNPAERELWRKIEGFEFDAADATKPFIGRLIKETGWTRHFADRVIAEYRKYLFLAATSDGAVSPSDAVDQVWHLHLLYTRSYWDRLCRDVMQRPFHHEPATGVESESSRLADQYRGTLSRYRGHFGDPPADIWPPPASSHRPSRFRRVDEVTHIVLPKSAGIIGVTAIIFVFLVLLIGPRFF